MVHFIADFEAPSGRNSPKPPLQKVYNASEPPYEGYHEIDRAAYESSSPDTAIVIDNGSHQTEFLARGPDTDDL